MDDPYQLGSGQIRFEIAGGKVLHRDDDATLVTTATTQATIGVANDRVSIRFSPGLRFIVHARSMGWMIEDVQWYAASYRFGGGVTVETERVAAWFAFDLATRKVHDTLVQLITDMFAGSVFARGDYDPFRDGELAAHVQALQAKLSGGTTSGPPLPTPILRGAGITVTLPSGMQQQQGDAVLRVRPGTRATVDAELAGGPTEGKLVSIRRAWVRLDPPVEIESGGNTLELRGFSAGLEACRPVIRVERDDLRIAKPSGGAAVAMLLFGALGALDGYAHGGPEGSLQGAGVGFKAVDGLAAGMVAEKFTAAAILALEQMRPELKRSVPLVDWDSLLCDAGGRPAMARPLSR